MVNTRERSINIVTDNKPKVLGGLSQKRQGSGYKDFSLPCHGHSTLPVERAHLTHSFVTTAEHGNPVCLPEGKASRKVSPWMCGPERMEEANATL